MSDKTKSSKRKKSTEESLWESAVKMRGTVEPSEYKHVVLGLIFLKFASDKFEERRSELISEGKEKYLEVSEFYLMKNVFYIPEISRWPELIKNGKQDDIAVLIDTALSTIEKLNPSLTGALPDNYYSRLNLDVAKLSALLDAINKIDTLKDKEQDIIGRIYEYFLLKFAISEGKGKGEFYTPKNVVNFMAQLIEPFRGIIYDPCCGSGGMFVQSLKFIESHRGNTKEISIYGQEGTPTTYKLAKMNLAIRGISANLGEIAADTFGKDQHKDLKADFILANPPFNLKDWRGSKDLVDDPRWSGYDVPPASNANYGWILHMISKLSSNGVAGFLLANGALEDPDTIEIRKRIIENDLVEAIIVLPREMFYSTDISVTLWIINKNKKAKSGLQNNSKVEYRDRQNEILFIDLRQNGIEFEKKYIELTDEEVAQSVGKYHSWQRKDSDYVDIPEYCYSASLEEIIGKEYSLVPSRYIVFQDSELQIPIATEVNNIGDVIEGILHEADVPYIESLKNLRVLLDEILVEAGTKYPVQKIGPLIEQSGKVNSNLDVESVRGISTTKVLIPTKANMTDVSLHDYRVLDQGEFVYTPDTSRRGDKIALAFNEGGEVLVSKIYTIFKVSHPDILLPEYLFLWFKRADFDRYARFHSWGSARETFDWDDMQEVSIPIPPPAVQESIVSIFRVLEHRVRVNDRIKELISRATPVIFAGVMSNSEKFDYEVH